MADAVARMLFQMEDNVKMSSLPPSTILEGSAVTSVCHIISRTESALN